MENVENVDPGDLADETRSKKKRKVRKVRRKKVKKSRDNGETEPDERDSETLKEFQEGARYAKRKSSSLSIEVEKMAQGKPLTHFQAMAMLRKALIASFIAKPKNRERGEVEMKNTECRRLSQGKEQAGEGVDAVKGMECLVLKDEDQPGQTEEKHQEKVQESSSTVKLVNKIAGKKSKWKIVEKEFVQGKDVSQNDAWKLILLSDFFPKGTTTFADIVDDQSDSSSEEDEGEESEEDGENEDVEEEGEMD